MPITRRFSDFRPIVARFASMGSCGHPIAPEQPIGYSRVHGRTETSCADCWRKWCMENQEAQAYEDSTGYID
jgi:hypothetical protein